MPCSELLNNALPILGTLGGLVVGALVEHIRLAAAFKREQKASGDAIRREKLEELYEEIERVRGWAGSTAFQLVQFSAVGKEPSDLLGKGEPFRIAMLSGIYAPTRAPELAAFREARERFGKALLEFIKNPKVEEGNPALAEIKAAVKAVETAAATYCERLAGDAAGTLPK